jgi:hypothetical protein
VSPVKYEVGFYIPEDGILHSHRREYLKSYTRKLDCKPDPSIEYFLSFLAFARTVLPDIFRLFTSNSLVRHS